MNSPIIQRPRGRIGPFVLIALPSVMVILLAGCVSASKESPAAQTLRQQRRTEATIPLPERVAQIERRLFSDFYDERLGLITSFNSVHDGRTEPGPVNVEQNAHLLIGLACKYAVTGDSLSEARAKRLLAGLEALDRANGLDGFLPLEAHVADDGKIEVTNERFVASSYTQLLYANVLASRLFSDPQLKVELRTQSRRMLDHLIAHDLVVVDARGRPLPFSDASLKTRIIGTGGDLDTLSFVRAAVFFAGDDEERTRLAETLRKRVEDDHGYARMPYILHFSIPFFEVPTVSSSWLNLMKLATLVEITGSEKYRELIRELVADYRAQQNPFFIALDLLYGPETSAEWKQRQWQIAWRRLETYPLTNDSLALQNLGLPSYRTRLPPHFVKNSLAIESTRPIPIYDLTGDVYQWKRNLLLLRGPIHGDGGKIYSGVDCYEAYWLLALVRAKSDRLGD